MILAVEARFRMDQRVELEGKVLGETFDMLGRSQRKDWEEQPR